MCVYVNTSRFITNIFFNFAQQTGTKGGKNRKEDMGLDAEGQVPITGQGRPSSAQLCPPRAKPRTESGPDEAPFSPGKAMKTPISQITGQRTNGSLGYGALNRVMASSYF